MLFAAGYDYISSNEKAAKEIHTLHMNSVGIEPADFMIVSRPPESEEDKKKSKNKKVFKARAYYADKTMCIYDDTAKIYKDEFYHYTRTIYHEGTHHVQMMKIIKFLENGVFDPNDPEQQHVVMTWANWWHGYINASDNSEAYYKNPIEVEARNLSTAVVQNIREIEQRGSLQIR